MASLWEQILLGAKQGSVKVMADYECWPLWDMGFSGPRNLNPESLPISIPLRNGLLMWAERYDRTLDRTNPTCSGFSSRTEREQFVADGLVLAERLAKELGPSWSVVYFDEITAEIQAI